MAFANNASRIAKYGDTAKNWWLRSPSTHGKSNAGVVNDDGAVNYDYVDYDQATRPAFNLNQDSVLFTSAAVDGKPAGVLGVGALKKVEAYTGSEWKVTLKDPMQADFTVAEKSLTAAPGVTVTLRYMGAWVGEIAYEPVRSRAASARNIQNRHGGNGYISAMIVDHSGEVLYYGRLAHINSESGTVSVAIPADLAGGSYTLNVFTEYCTGDKTTDYASNFSGIALTVTEVDLPKTGDSSHIALWSAMLMLSLVGMFALLRRGGIKTE